MQCATDHARKAWSQYQTDRQTTKDERHASQHNFSSRCLPGRLLLALGTAVLLHTSAHAQNPAYPTKPVTVVVPFSPGCGTDIGARLIAQKLTAKWGQTVIVENRAGSGGWVGADVVAKAKPDGYTLLVGNVGTQAINSDTQQKLISQGATPWTTMPASLQAIINRDRASYGKVIADRTIKVE